MTKSACFTKEYLDAFFTRSLPEDEYDKIAVLENLSFDMQQYILFCCNVYSAKILLAKNTCLHPDIQDSIVKDSYFSGSVKNSLAGNSNITREAAFILLKSGDYEAATYLAKNSGLSEKNVMDMHSWAVSEAMQLLDSKQCDLTVFMFLQHSLLTKEHMHMLSHIKAQGIYNTLLRNKHLVLDTHFSSDFLSYAFDTPIENLVSSGVLDLLEEEFETFVKMLPSWTKPIKQLVEAIKALTLTA